MTELETAIGRVINDPDLTADQLDTLLPIVDAARMWLNPNEEALMVLDDHPDLYEFSRRQVEALEELGVKMIPVKNKHIVQDVLVGVAALASPEMRTND